MGARVLITGGGGWVGHRLGCKLSESGYDVILFDVRAPATELLPNMTFLQGNICDAKQVHAACKGVDIVYHIASYGMSGRESLRPKLIYSVNVGGTQNVIDACLAQQVPRLVYTSTVNVIFAGKPIYNGDETMPYRPLSEYRDAYSKTKCIAEQMVLKADASPFADLPSTCLRTCSVRPAGIYGPGEMRHIPRAIGLAEQGLFKVSFGEPDMKVDWLHVDNLVMALTLAGEGLTEEKKCVAGGEAYFISDGTPMHNLELFRVVLRTLGHPIPQIRIPNALAYIIAALIELLHTLISWLWDFQPMLTCAEVNKCVVTHYFSNNKATSQLGYVPTKYDLHETAEWYVRNGYASTARSVRRRQEGGAMGVALRWSVLLLMLLSCMVYLVSTSVVPFGASRAEV